MADSDLIWIRMKLSGAKEVAAQAKTAATQIGGLGTAAQRAQAKAQASLGRIGGAMQRIGKHGAAMRATGSSMSTGLTLPLALAGGAAVKVAGDFETAMNQVAVATGAPASEIASLRDLAMDLGNTSMFSANEVAQAMLELGKSGLSTSAIKGGALDATVMLAAADGQMTLADAAGQASAAMNVFGLRAKDTGKIAGALAGGANASQANVGDLGLSLQQAGTSAAAARLSIYETVGALTAFAKNGIAASDAGTSFKTFLARLNPQTSKARDLMRQLDLSFYDSHGRLVGLTEISGRMQKAFKGMSDQQRNSAMQTLFGSDAIRAANILYESGPKGMAKYIRATKDQGAASRMAKANMSGMNGQLEQAKGAMETAGIAAGTAAAPSIIMLAGVVSALAQGFASLPEPVQKTIVVLGLVVAAIGPAVWIAGALATAIKGVGIALTFLSANPIGLVVIGIAAVVASLVMAYKKSETFRNAIDAIAGAIGDAFKWAWGAVKDAVAWIATAIGNAIGFFRGLGPKVGNALSGVGKIIVAPFKAAFDVIAGIVEGVVDTVTWVVDKVQWAVEKLGEITGDGAAEAIGLNIGPNPYAPSGVQPNTEREGYSGGGASDEPALGGRGGRRRKPKTASAAVSPEGVFDFTRMGSGGNDGTPYVLMLDSKTLARGVARAGDTAQARA